MSDGWISVKTELPEDGSDLVLVVVKRELEQPLRDIGWHDDRGWHWRSQNKPNCRGPVTHWQPLPAPPKEEAP